MTKAASPSPRRRKVQKAESAAPVGPSRPVEIANLAARARYIERIDNGGDRITQTIRTTGHNASCREPLEGMDNNTLNLRLADAFGTTSVEFVDAMSANLLTYFNSSNDRRATREMNAALAVLDGMKPENEVEAMLLTQMVATNDSAMRCLGQISNAMSAETYGNLAVKLMRTFTAQTEALAKLRRKGEQIVRVVHVHPGGQAIVGDVHNHKGGGGASTENEAQPHGTSEFQERTALPCPDAPGNGVPIPGDAERPVPHSRRPVTRRATRKSARVEARVLEPGDGGDAATGSPNAKGVS